jgi:hypothetical protein
MICQIFSLSIGRITVTKERVIPTGVALLKQLDLEKRDGSPSPARFFFVRRHGQAKNVCSCSALINFVDNLSTLAETSPYV